jgi:hypothetical protein
MFNHKWCSASSEAQVLISIALGFLIEYAENIFHVHLQDVNCNDGQEG